MTRLRVRLLRWSLSVAARQLERVSPAQCDAWVVLFPNDVGDRCGSRPLLAARDAIRDRFGSEGIWR